MARSRAGIPDMKYIRQEVPINEVAQALGLRIRGRNLTHCWRIENHKNGDRTPSLSFHKNRAKCFVCDLHPLSTLDLVSLHENCGLDEAAKWFRGRRYVPEIPPNTKLRRPERWRQERAGVGDAFWDSLVRTGFWASLDDAGRAVLVAL